MADLTIDTKYRMLSGYEIPALGFGLSNVDSARVYRNEGPCSEAIKRAGIPRNEIFFTSKVPPRSMGYEQTKYLIHAPYGGKEGRLGTWRALVEAQQAGQIRSIGVSNYGVHHLDELESYIKELEGQQGKGKGGEISVGQWEVHPWLARPDIVEWCQKRGVVVQAYCPIVRNARSNEPVLQPLVKKYGKTACQVLLRWSLQKGLVPLPKSVTLSRIEENANIYDFELTPEEMKSLEMDEGRPRCTFGAIFLLSHRAALTATQQSRSPMINAEEVIKEMYNKSRL
ncbi:hypothetical protein Q9189_005704 [Teloschistes chrysophthalmus]